MITSMLIGLGCIFFILGHSTLLFFMGKDLPSMPIVDAIFPWPKRGKFVSILCFWLSTGSFFLMFSLPPEIQSSATHSAWKVLVTFAVFPSAVYALYLVRRIHKQSDGLLYFPSDATRREWSLPLLISAFVSVLFSFIK